MPSAGLRESALRASALAVSASLLAGCSSRVLPLGATEQARSMHDTWIVFLRIGIGVAAIVYSLIAWCLIRYRKRPTDIAYPVQFRRNDRMEIVYTVIPILLVSALFLISFAAERHVEAIPLHQQVVVDVTGFRWSWRFEYPELGISVVGTHDRPPEFVLPVGETTRLNITSVDVDHSFWVPDFLFKRDAIPGLRNVFAWTPTTIGTFRGECGEFCGLDHAVMSFSIKVVSDDEFARWVGARRRVALAGSSCAGSVRDRASRIANICESRAKLEAFRAPLIRAVR